MATVKYWGHACFLITTAEGFRILVDPYLPGGFNGAFKYQPITDEADVVLVTHEHADHNSVAGLAGAPLVLRGNAVVQGVTFTTVAAQHDAQGGKERGEMRVFTWAADGVRFCHVGDLGHVFTEQQLALLGPVDVLFLPTGGFFTIDPAAAHQVVAQVAPRVTIPMHYLTPRLQFPPQYKLAPVDDFLAGQDNVLRVGGDTWQVTGDTLPAEPTIVVLDAVE